MKYTLITGASTGIGKDFAMEYAAKGNNLILVARNKKRLEELTTKISSAYGVKTETIPMDLSITGAAEKLFALTQKKKLTVERLINNAGAGLNGDFIQNSFQEESSILQLNVNSLMQLCHLYGNEMVAAKSGQILNVASTAAFQPGPYMANYYATKAYVLSLSEALHIEMKPYGVQVTVLCPGATKTEFFKTEKNMATPSFAMDSRIVAKVGIQALKNGHAIVIPGFMNRFLVFSIRFTPRFVIRYITTLFNTKLFRNQKHLT